jgi:hypothetical protein
LEEEAKKSSKRRSMDLDTRYLRTSILEAQIRKKKSLKKRIQI